MEYIKRKGKVIIKTLPRETVTNVHEFANRGPRGLVKMDKTKVGDRAKDCFMATYNKKTGLIHTGLNEYYDNPFVGKNPLTLPTDFPRSFETAEKVKLQHILEAEHGVPYNFYTDKAPTSGTMKPDQITFFQKFRFTLNDGSTVLDMNKVNDVLTYYIVVGNTKQFAPSYEAWRKHQHPYATHYIFVEEEHQEREFSKKQLKNRAIAYLEEFSTKQPQDVITFCKALKKQVGDISPQIAYSQLDDYINQTGSTAKNNAEKFVELVERFKKPDGKIYITGLALLQDLLHYRILTGRQDIYTWLSASQIIGNRDSEAVAYLTDPNKQPEVSQMKAELQQKLIK